MASSEHSLPPIVLCCATGEEEGLAPIIERLSVGSRVPEVLADIDTDPRMLGETLDQLPGVAFVGVFVGTGLGDGDVLRIRGIFGARRGPFHELFVLRSNEDIDGLYARAGSDHLAPRGGSTGLREQESEGPFSGMRRAWRRRRSNSYVSSGGLKTPSEEGRTDRIDPLQQAKSEDPAAQVSLSALSPAITGGNDGDAKSPRNAVDVVGAVSISATSAREDIELLIREGTSEAVHAEHPAEQTVTDGGRPSAREWSIGKVKERGAIEILEGVGPIEIEDDAPYQGAVGDPAEGVTRPRNFLVRGLVAVATFGGMVWLMSAVVGEGVHPAPGSDGRDLPRAATTVTGTTDSGMTESGTTGSGTTGGGTAGPETTGVGTTGADTTDSDATGTDTTGTDATGTETTGTGTDATGTETTGTETTGTETTGTETTGVDTTGADTTGAAEVESRTPPPRLRPQSRRINRERTDNLLAVDAVVGSGTLRVGVGWKDAHAICRENSFQGYDEFRMPTFDELSALASKGHLELGSAHWTVSVAKGMEPGFVRAVLNGREVARETEFDVAAIACVRSKNTVPRER